MNKNAKKVMIGVIIFLSLMLTGKIIDILGEGNNKCDYCGAPAGIEKGTKEYCVDCFSKSGENFWE